MRHPTTGLSEDDLSRLTGSSSSTASCGNNSSSPSSSSSSTTKNKSTGKESHLGSHQRTTEKAARLAKHSDKSSHSRHNHHHQRHTHDSVIPSQSHYRISSTYLPEFINPLEWQKSRKRKERLDSTSSLTQDRKLQRSNSEELLPHEVSQASETNTAENGNSSFLKAASGKTAAVIRRVSSEDFKKSSSYAAYLQELRESATDGDGEDEPNENKTEQAGTTVDENDASLANRQEQQHKHEQLPSAHSEAWTTTGLRDMTRHHTRFETSPARSQRHSPVRSAGGSNSSGSNAKLRDSDDSECEHEKRRSSERFCKTRAPPGRKASGVAKKSSSSSSAKYLLPTQRRNDENVYKYDLTALKYERRGFVSKKFTSGEKSIAASDLNDNNLIDLHQQAPQLQTPTPPATADADDLDITPTTATTTHSRRRRCSNPIPLPTSAQEALPWVRPEPEDQAPVLSRRYGAIRQHPADSIDTAAKLSKVMPYPQHFHQQSAAQLFTDDLDGSEPLNNFRAFTSLENMRTREVMQQVMPAMMSFQSPEERLKQVNKRLTAMKKKLAQLEETYEARLGYRPSQAERQNDKYMKNILAELNKLRKERHELKSDPMRALGLKVSGGLDATKKLEKIKATLSEIEQNLTDKREDTNRSEVLDELTPDQLVQEKTAVQHGLLYFESLYGRPGTKDERDAARSLYDRYRQLKRMVSRSVLLSGSAVAGAPELPTILEHEAMVFESTPQQYSSNNSTETTNTPSDPVAPPNASSDDSTTTTTAAPSQEATAQAADANENISDLSIEQLWEHLEKTREEKKLFKRIIREFETVFEEQNGRKMLKSDRKTIEETYAQYKEKKAKARLLQALINKHTSRR